MDRIDALSPFGRFAHHSSQERRFVLARRLQKQFEITDAPSGRDRRS
jgi:hypothetical protein